jgi:ribosomal protein S18 acetylase RimI-like enzyme
VSVILRPAATDDADFVGWIMLTAGRSHVSKGGWELLVEGEERCSEFLRGLALTPTRSYCHHTAFTLAEVDGVPAAGMCGYDAERSGMESLVEAVREVFDEMDLSRAEREAGASRMAPFLSCAPVEPTGVWIVESVAARPEYRRQGLVRRLLEHKLEQGRQAGYRSAQISLLIGNTAAQNAYESVGFRIQDEKRNADFEAALGSPGVARMSMDL